MRLLLRVLIAVHQVLNADVVAAPESLTIGFAIAMRHRWMTVFIAVLYARRTVVLVILARAFDAIVKAL
jgi:hypothetical protein